MDFVYTVAGILSAVQPFQFASTCIQIGQVDLNASLDRLSLMIPIINIIWYFYVYLAVLETVF